MTERLTVSCVIPTHRRAHLLEEALASVLAQTDPVDEVVVVSDVADETTRELCAAAARRGAPVSYLERPTEQSGASSSRNAGAAASSGAVLAFLDDDDLWAPGYVATVRAALGREHRDAVITWMTTFNDRTETDGASIEPDLAATAVLARNPGMTGSNLAVLRDAFFSVDGFDARLPVKNDTDFFYRFLQQGHRYTVNAQRQVRQRRHSSGQLTAHSDMRADGVERYIEKYRSVLSREQLRHLRFSIARMRANAAPSRIRGLRYRLRALTLYSWAQFLRDRRSRRHVEFFQVTEFSDLRTGAR